MDIPCRPRGSFGKISWSLRPNRSMLLTTRVSPFSQSADQSTVTGTLKVLFLIALFQRKQKRPLQ